VYPARTAGGESAGRNDAVHVGMRTPTPTIP
jgi:hypothetical protein